MPLIDGKQRRSAKHKSGLRLAGLIAVNSNDTIGLTADATDTRETTNTELQWQWEYHLVTLFIRINNSSHIIMLCSYFEMLTQDETCNDNQLLHWFWNFFCPLSFQEIIFMTDGYWTRRLPMLSRMTKDQSYPTIQISTGWFPGNGHFIKKEWLWTICWDFGSYQ